MPPGAWMSVCCECCVLSVRGIWNGLITRPEESYRLWRVIVCDQENLKLEEAKARYRAVKIQPQSMGCNTRKTNKQCKTITITGLMYLLAEHYYRISTNINS